MRRPLRVPAPVCPPPAKFSDFPDFPSLIRRRLVPTPSLSSPLVRSNLLGTAIRPRDEEARGRRERRRARHRHRSLDPRRDSGDVHAVRGGDPARIRVGGRSGVRGGPLRGAPSLPRSPEDLHDAVFSGDLGGKGARQHRGLPPRAGRGLIGAHWGSLSWREDSPRNADRRMANPETEEERRKTGRP
jgi:hypothetical protein